jgi:prolyl oligopeptidase
MGKDADGEAMATIAYPAVRRDEMLIERLHGVDVPDPYRHLEDPESAETAQFVAEQNSLTESYLYDCGVDRAQVLAQLRANYDYPKIGTAWRVSDSLFAFYKKEGLQNQSVLYTCREIGGEPTALLDPNQLSADGTTSLGSVSFSRDASKLAYSISDGGSDWRTIRVRDVATGRDDPDSVRWCKFTGIEWAYDGSGFFYNRFAPPAAEREAAVSDAAAGRHTALNTCMQTCFHRLGSAQDADELVFELPEDDKAMFDLSVVGEGAFLALSVRKGKFNQLWWRDAALPPPPSPPADAPAADSAARWGFTKLIADYESKWELITTSGREWILFTNCGAPKYRIVGIHLDEPAPASWRTVVAESEHTLGGGDYAAGGHCVDGKLILKYMNHVKDELHQFALDGTFECTLPLPSLGVVSSVSGRREDRDCFYQFESFLTPPVVYRYTPATRLAEVVMTTEVPGLDTSGFEIEQVFVPSSARAGEAESVRVPMFIVKTKGLALDGSAPATLFGYGGFNVVKTITFDPVNLTLLQLLSQGVGGGGGGVWALANIRGGGEYGRDWHQAGTKHRKQNCYDDFIACAEFMIDRGYTSPRRLCIHGASNGGLLVTAVANQRPELFACVVCQVGLLDMLRFHKFTIGHFWCADYGSPDEPLDFEHILKYSPYHNVRAGKPYPAAIFTTADRDDRVVPLHTLKMVAELQHVIGRDPANAGQRCAPRDATARAPSRPIDRARARADNQPGGRAVTHALISHARPLPPLNS